MPDLNLLAKEEKLEIIDGIKKHSETWSLLEGF